jgi:hypothetical protein
MGMCATLCFLAEVGDTAMDNCAMTSLASSESRSTLTFVVPLSTRLFILKLSYSRLWRRGEVHGSAALATPLECLGIPLFVLVDTILTVVRLTLTGKTRIGPSALPEM